MKRLSYCFKKMLLALSLGAVFLLSGIFFAGCGESPASKITLSANKTSVTLFVGETDTVEFTIGNYVDSINSEISFSLIDSSVSQGTSEHVSLKVLSQEGAKTVVQLVGVSGGKTTLVAMTTEGSKTCSVEINVKQYSSSISLKDDVLLYVSENSVFYPTEALFNFDSNSTETSLSFYRTDVPENAGDNNLFAYAKLETDESTGNKVVRYYFENGQINNNIFDQGIVDGNEILVYAKYDFYEYIDGIKEEKTLFVPMTFYTVFGFTNDQAIQVLNDKGETIVNNDELNIIVNSKTQENVVNLNVTIPYSLIDKSQSGLLKPVQENSFVQFSYQAENSSVLSVQKGEVIDNGDGTMSFDLQIESSTLISQETTLILKVFYKIGDNSFEFSDDSSVCQTLTVNVDINVAPNNIIINDVDQNSESNKFTLYNNYDSSNFGWKTLNLKVYDTGSDYEGVMVVFDENKVSVRQNGTYLNSGDLILKKDINIPVEIRGVASNVESLEYDEIVFTVVSEFIGEDEVAPSYTVYYQICQGATSLSFNNEIYRYDETNINSGVFVSSSSKNNVFEGIYANQLFSYATVTFVEGDESVIGVSYDSVNRKIEAGENRYYVVLNLTPRKTGQATYSVVLDNGVKINVTFKVIDTFEDLSVTLAGLGNDGVQSTEKLTGLGDDFADGMKIIMQNFASGEEVSFGKYATIQLLSSNGIEIFSNVSYSSNYENLAKIVSAGNGAYTITTNTYGEAEIIFSVSGVTVDENFMKKSDTVKKIKIVLVSYVPTSSFVVSNTRTNNNSSNVELFVGNTVSDSSLQTVSFSASVKPNVAYGFYNPINETYENKTYNLQYVYWLVDGAQIFENKNGNWIATTQMVYGNVYRIGMNSSQYYGTFDSTSMTFTINKNQGQTFSFVMYASLRQYGTTRYYPITIKGSQYANVQTIYSNMGRDDISFTAGEKSFEIGVFLGPNDITETGITVLYTNQNSSMELPSLILSQEIVKKETYAGSGIWTVSVSLNEEVLTQAFNGKFAGLLEIVPTSWMSDGQVISTYVNNTLKFNVTYQDGTESNPYALLDPEDILNIGSTPASLKAHYSLSSTINMAGYASNLPIQGSFSGSIVGLNDNAKITGLNISKGNQGNYGLFEEIASGAKISNIVFEGNFNINNDSQIKVGLLASVNKGTIENCEFLIGQSTISCAQKSVIGGVVAQNQGTISSVTKTESTSTRKLNVLFEDYLTITVNGDVIVGGICGENSGDIFDLNDKEGFYGYSTYSVYALIKVFNGTEKDYNKNLVGKAGAIAGLSSSGNIYNILAGGEIWASNVGGLVGDLQSGALYGSTTRVFVRGKEIGLIIYNVEDNVEDEASLGYDDKGQQSSIKIEATDDGVRMNEFASMGIRYVDEEYYKSAKVGEMDVSGEINTILINGRAKDNYYETPVSYINRLCDSEFIESQDTTQPIIINSYADTSAYYGDYLIIYENENKILNRALFNKQSTSFSISANEDFGFSQLHCDDCGGKESCTCTEKVFFAYYFQAESYFDGTEFTTTNLNEIQKQLDVLNRVKPGDKLYPLSIVGQDVQIKSNSSNLEISSTGEMYIKGTGVAQIEVYSLLNENQREIIYLNIINYFDYKSYADGIQTGIFKLDNLILGDETKFNVYSNKSVEILVSPSYSLSYVNSTGKSLAYGVDGDLYISADGELLLDNQYIIKLAQNKNFDIDIDVVGENEDGSLKYGNFETSSNSVVFSKKTNLLETAGTDTISLSAGIYAGIQDKKYLLNVTTLENVIVNFYEGAQAIYSKLDVYSITSSNAVADQVSISSDDLNDKLHVKIYNSNYEEIDSMPSKETDSTDATKKHLFNISISSISGAKLTFDVKISVDVASNAFKNRFTNNIYDEYTVVYYAESNGESVAKEVKLTLKREAVDVIVATNYPSMSNIDQESDKIVPGQTGILSISVSPVDADFDSIYIKNNAMNYLEGSSVASFAVGYIDLQEKDESGYEVVFNPINYVATAEGARVYRSELEKNEAFNGQIYVRYIFSNNAVIDETDVAIDVIVEQSPQNFSKTFTYSLLKSQGVSIEIDGYPNKTQVARGMEYKLNIQNQGFDDESVVVNSSNPQLGRIEKRDDGYYLVLTNNEINYSNNANKFTLSVSASKEDAFGELVTTSDELNLTVLEYVINYYAQDNVNQDVILGMNNGVISSAVGDKTSLELAFEGMIEYNTDNQSVANSVAAFLLTLRKEGKWDYYTDLNANNASAIQIKPIPLEKEDATTSTLSLGTSITTPYMKITDYSFTTYIAHNPENRHYFFSYSGQYIIQNGVYVWTKKVNEGDVAGEGYTEIYTEFSVYSYMRGSEESPNPITTYEEFLNMDAGGNYILLNDINVPADSFVPLNTAVATFDGNNHYFIFDSAKYELGNVSAGGLFGTVSESTVLKNIKIKIGSANTQSVTLNSSATTSAYIGMVAGQNNGTITNAQVEMADGAKLYVTFDVAPASAGFYFGGIVGQNSGYLTNSRSMISVESTITMGGVAGVNSKIISSSAFKEGNLISRSQYATIFSVGGFVAENTENATIMTSYTSGIVDMSKPYSDEEVNGKTSQIDSRVSTGAFIHTNKGTISDCYANLPVLSDSSSAGFVLYNEGKIVRSFTTSKILRGNSAVDYYFASDSSGSFEDCYYITGEINTSLFNKIFDGVTELKYYKNKQNDFEDLTKYFANYSYSSNPSYNSVWFYSKGSTSSEFNGAQFAGGRLELVSANLVATGQRVSAGTSVSQDGVVTYLYETAPNSPANGTAYNPYIIHSPETMEDYFSKPNNIVDGYYRIVKDIDYSSQVSNFSNLYKLTFKGNLEANGMKISGIKITSNDSLTYAGLFGSVSGTSTKYATIMNLNLQPKLVDFANANVVGSLSGLVQYANIYNITVYASTITSETTDVDNLITASGKNIVGGVIGLTQGEFAIKNVDAYISAFASFVPAVTNENDFETSDLSKTSFAGGVVGYLGGRGQASIITIKNGAVNITGAKAGLMFGGISSQSKADQISVNINAEMYIKAYSYGGMIAGELKGSISNVYVYGLGVQHQIFELKPYVATAVGGLVGLAKDSATIDLAYMGQGFAVGNQPIATVDVNTINYVGGLIGLVDGGSVQVSRTVVDADLTARNVLGGLIGQVSANTNFVTVDQVAIKPSTLKVEGQNTKPVVGGIIGNVESQIVTSTEGQSSYTGAGISVQNSYVQADITMETFAYTSEMEVNFGGIIGNTNNLTPSLDTIYSTSKFNITVEDKSSTDATANVQRKYFSNSGTTTFLDSFKIGDSNYIDSDAADKDTAKDVVFENKVKQTTNANYVFNSSIWSYMTLKIDDILNKNFTTIKARKYLSDIYIYQNEYGTDVFAANGGGETLGDLAFAQRLNLDRYKGLFMTLDGGKDLSGKAASDIAKIVGANIVENGTYATNIVNGSGSFDEGWYKYVGLTVGDTDSDTDSDTVSDDDTITLNFVKVASKIWNASLTDFSTLAFEELLKI